MKLDKSPPGEQNRGSLLFTAPVAKSVDAQDLKS